MKKLVVASAAMALLTGAANAADLPRRAAPPPVFVPPPLFTWTGPYAGTHTSYIFTDRQQIATSGISPINVTNVTLGRRPASVSDKTDGFAKIGGGFGYNYQLTPGSGFVIGAAFDIDYTDLHKNVFNLGAPSVVGGGGNPNAFQQGVGYLGTVNGKIGYAFDRFLVYGTGGLAFGHVTYNADFYSPAGLTAFTGSFGGFETGYNYGGGIAYAISPDSFLNKLSPLGLLGVSIGSAVLKAEYIHYDLGSRTLVVAAVPGVGIGAGYTSRFQTEGNLVRVGLSYKFGGPL